MDVKYKEILDLFNQCEYEKAYDRLSDFSFDFGDKGILLLEECKKEILHQYIYLIEEAEKQKDISRANQLKALYTKKYGKTSEISEPKEDPELELAKTIYISVSVIIIIFLCLLLVFFSNRV